MGEVIEKGNETLMRTGDLVVLRSEESVCAFDLSEVIAFRASHAALYPAHFLILLDGGHVDLYTREFKDEVEQRLLEALEERSHLMMTIESRVGSSPLDGEGDEQ